MSPKKRNTTEISVIKAMQERIQQLENTIEALKTEKAEEPGPIVKNKDGLPIGTMIQAEVDDVGTVWLRAHATHYRFEQLNNDPVLKGARFNSLSAAAEFFSGIKRKSGWVYWRTMEGRTLKDAFKG